jgi:outer membrane protein assembly factor BamB
MSLSSSENLLISGYPICYMDVLKACIAVIVILALIQQALFLPMTRIAEEPITIDKIEIHYGVVYFPGKDEKYYTITRKNGGYFSDTGKNIDPELIHNLMGNFTDFYEVEIPVTSYDDYFVFDYDPHIEVTITSRERKIKLYSQSGFHCFVPWNIDFYGKEFVQFNGKIPSALFKILVELDDYWQNHGMRDNGKVARWECYSPTVPEDYLDKDFSPFFPHSEPETSPEALAGTRHVKWKRDVGPFVKNPILVDGLIFMANSRVVTCIHSKTGKTLWSYTTKGRIPFSYLSHQYIQYIDGYLIVATENGVTCLDSESGAVIWDIDSIPIADAPVYHAGNVFLGVERDTVVDLLCIDVKSGETVWKFEIDEGKYIPSNDCNILVEDGVYFAMGEQVILRLDEETGDVIWDYDMSEPKLSELYAVSNNRLVVKGRIGYGAICLDTETGKEVWESPEECDAEVYGNTIFLTCYSTCDGVSNQLVDSSGDVIYGDGDFRKLSVCQYQDGILYLGVSDIDAIIAFDTYSMTELWRYAPVSAKGRILVYRQEELVPSSSCSEDLFLFEEKGVMEAFDMKGSRLWEREIRAYRITGFTVHENHLYVCANDGMVYCFDPMTGTILWNHDTGARVMGPEGKEELYIFGIEGNLMFVHSKFRILIAYSV